MHQPITENIQVRSLYTLIYKVASRGNMGRQILVHWPPRKLEVRSFTPKYFPPINEGLGLHYILVPLVTPKAQNMWLIDYMFSLSKRRRNMWKSLWMQTSHMQGRILVVMDLDLSLQNLKANLDWTHNIYDIVFGSNIKLRK